MLHRTTKIDVCVNKLSNYFKESWDYTNDELKDERIHILTNQDETCFFIIRCDNSKYTHYDFGFVDENLRGKGIGSLCVKELVKYAVTFNKPIRATVRLENVASYRTMEKAGFKASNRTFVVGTSVCKEMIYQFPRKINLNKYYSIKPSSCGLFVLSALSDLKYNNYIEADKLNAPCIANYGIQKETMVQLIMSIFKDYNFKVVSNYTDDTEHVFHIIESHFTKLNSFAIACIKDDLIYDHWILITEYDGKFFHTLDSINGEECWTKYKLFSKMILSNMFTILL